MRLYYTPNLYDGRVSFVRDHGQIEVDLLLSRLNGVITSRQVLRLKWLHDLQANGGVREELRKRAIKLMGGGTNVMVEVEAGEKVAIVYLRKTDELDGQTVYINDDEYVVANSILVACAKTLTSNVHAVHTR